MAKPLSIALPGDHILSGGYTVRVSAIDPNTGAVVSGVNVQNVTIQVEQYEGGNLSSGVFKAIFLRTGLTV